MGLAIGSVGYDNIVLTKLKETIGNKCNWKRKQKMKAEMITG